MKNLSSFCTYTFTNCALHPQNHDNGCSLCISKNLKNEEIPNCFFNMVDGFDNRSGYKFKDFAESVLNKLLECEGVHNDDKFNRNKF